MIFIRYEKARLLKLLNFGHWVKLKKRSQTAKKLCAVAKHRKRFWKKLARFQSFLIKSFSTTKTKGRVYWRSQTRRTALRWTCINRLFWAIVAVVEKRKCFIPFLMLATRLVLWMCTRIICWAPFKIVGSKDLRQNFCLSIKFLPFADQYTAFCHSKKIGMREVME